MHTVTEIHYILICLKKSLTYFGEKSQFTKQKLTTNMVWQLESIMFNRKRTNVSIYNLQHSSQKFINCFRLAGMKKSSNIWSEVIISPASNIFSSCQPKWYWQFLSDRMLPISSFSYFMCSILTSSRENLFIFRFSFFQKVGWLTYLKEKGSKFENGIYGKEFQVSSVFLALVLTLKIDFWRSDFGIFWHLNAIDNQYLFLQQFAHFHCFAKRKNILQSM